MMKFYIAAKFKARHRIKTYNQRIEALGLANTCPWFLMDTDDSADEDSLGGYSREEHAVMADRDLSAVREADIFIIDTIDVSETGGREVELGAALILGKVILHVGPIRPTYGAAGPSHSIRGLAKAQTEVSLKVGLLSSFPVAQGVKIEGLSDICVIDGLHTKHFNPWFVSREWVE